MVKNLPANAGDIGYFQSLGRSPKRRHGNPLQCSCMENPTDTGVHGVTVRHEGACMHMCSTKRCQASYNISLCMFVQCLPPRAGVHSCIACSPWVPSTEHTVDAPEILAADRLCGSIWYEGQHTDMETITDSRWTRGLGPKLGYGLQTGNQSHGLE